MLRTGDGATAQAAGDDPHALSSRRALRTRRSARFSSATSLRLSSLARRAPIWSASTWRRILSHLGVDVNRLIRLSYGPFQLLELKPGEAEPVRRHVLADQMGARLANELNLNEVADEKRALRRVRNARRDDKA